MLSRCVASADHGPSPSISEQKFTIAHVTRCKGLFIQVCCGASKSGERAAYARTEPNDVTLPAAAGLVKSRGSPEHSRSDEFKLSKLRTWEDHSTLSMAIWGAAQVWHARLPAAQRQNRLPALLAAIVRKWLRKNYLDMIG